MADDLIVTAAHVVSDATTVSAKSGDRIVQADLLGINESTDTALLRSSAPLADRSMELAERDPRQGSSVLVLGYPLGVEDLRNTSGRITGGEGSADYGDQQVSPVITTDAAINPGNSGGPVLDRESHVVALVSGAQQWTEDYTPVDGVKYLVPVSAFEAQIDDWSDDEPQPLASCEGDVEPTLDDGGGFPVDIQSDDPLAQNLAQTLYTHGSGINSGSYDTAWAMFTEALQERFDFDSWSEDLWTTYWTDLLVNDVYSDGDLAMAQVDLTTRQEPENSSLGESCTIFHLDYRLAYVDDVWLIDGVDVREPTEAC